MIGACSMVWVIGTPRVAAARVDEGFARAREMRDMTVPMGTSRMMAMSLYLISSTSQSRRASRSGG